MICHTWGLAPPAPIISHNHNKKEGNTTYYPSIPKASKPCLKLSCSNIVCTRSRSALCTGEWMVSVSAQLLPTCTRSPHRALQPLSRESESVSHEYTVQSLCDEPNRACCAVPRLDSGWDRSCGRLWSGPGLPFGRACP